MNEVILWDSCAEVCGCLLKVVTLFCAAGCPSVLVLHPGMLRELLTSLGGQSAIPWKYFSA